MDANQYYESLISQGYSPSDAVNFTANIYPGFQPSMQVTAVNPPPVISIDLGEVGVTSASSFAAPVGKIGASTGSVVAGTITAGGIAAGGGTSVGTIAVVSILVLGGLGTGGYFLYEYLTEPDFYGEVYWSEYGSWGYMFEDNSISMVYPQYEGGCEMYEDYEKKKHEVTGKDDLCFLEIEDKMTITEKGGYYEICIDWETHDNCIKIYPKSNAIIIQDDSDYCEVFLSDVEPKNEFTSDQNEHNWMSEFQDKSEVIKEDGPDDCIYQDVSSNSGGLDAYSFADRDAAGVMSADGGDDLVHIQMVQGDDLHWAVLEISIVVDSNQPQTCVEAAAADGTEACSFARDADSTWSVSEEITITEGTENNLCGENGYGCEVDVQVTKIGIGGEDDKVLAVVSAYADTN